MSSNTDHLHGYGGGIDAQFVEGKKIERMLDPVVSRFLLEDGEPFSAADAARG